MKNRDMFGGPDTEPFKRVERERERFLWLESFVVAFHIRWTISDSLKAARRTNCQFWKHDCSFPWLPYSQGIRERETEREGKVELVKVHM